MNAQQFVDRLTCAAPSIEQIMAIGLSKGEAKKLKDRSQCISRSVPIQIENGNEIVVLMKHWDLSHLEIGMIQFFGQPVKHKGTLQIGDVEADPLLLSDATGEIFVEELNTGGHLLWKVARDDRRFLDAVSTAAEFLNDCLLDNVEFTDTKIARQFAERCASLAGGDQYLSFYLMLLGGE